MLGLAASLLVTLTAQANQSPRALQEAFMTALRANDAAGLAACYAEEAVSFAVSQTKGIGPEFVKADWEGFFSTMTVVSAELSESHLETHGDTAIAWGLFTIVAQPVDGGEPVELQGRYMDVARNIDGVWLYVADHASMPIP
jgi:uncharacterized protein (TIGR02246 family)